MKLKLLLIVLVFLTGIVNAQDTIKTLIISEALVYRADYNYIELTNVGEDPINMGDFKLGKLGPFEGEYFTGTNETWLPEITLAPGESYVIATVLDFTEKMHKVDPDHFGPRVTPKELWDLADWQIHTQETNSIAGIDSISPINSFMGVWDGRDGWYLEQHISETDSVVVDQVNGWFDDDGVNFNQAYDVAGFTEATVACVLVRKFNVKQGNTTFVAGIGEDDSEWIPIPLAKDDESQLPWRSPYWTVGNHGDYNLDENTLVSDKLEVDLVNKTITAPWGTRNLDDFVRSFEMKPGIGWRYHFSEAREDSAYVSARTGDKLTVYVCGNDADVETFNIILAEPTADANIVLPMYDLEEEGFYSEDQVLGNQEVYHVTVDAPVMDSITNDLFGIPYATSVDSLLKYLEKAPKASWEIVWVDGMERTNVKTGDILRVTAENGSAKDYYIKTDMYRPDDDANLSSITWPDIPAELKDVLGWSGDTIPNFSPTIYNYSLQVPSYVDGIPALVAKTRQLNAKVEVTRAVSLQGSPEQRTITFTVTAEDGTTQNVYSVLLTKEKSPTDIQPFNAEPFISEIVFQDMWNNGFVEICNPGNQPLDLSNYMLVCDGSTTPAAAIQAYSGVDDWGARYRKYVPGYKWVNEANWSVNPGRLEQDINVSPMVFPGDVFVGGHINGGNTWGWADANFTGTDPRLKTDVFLNSPDNPWGETYTEWASAVHEWTGNNYYLFKIVNDSVKSGEKPANDPNDFILIDVFGHGDGSQWSLAGQTDFGSDQCSNFIRKPSVAVGNPTYGASMGTNEDDSEWLVYRPRYWEARNVGWPNNILNDTKDVGQHYLNEVTFYKSTVSSTVYKVSPGYGKNGQLESIKGMTTGTTSDVFLSNIIKADENQDLKVKGIDGELAMDALLSNNDTLVVMSADSINTTKYLLEVSEEGLSSDARLTSSRYTIDVVSEPKSAGSEEAGTATIKGFEYGTTLSTILDNITVPEGASLDVINGDGAYVSLLMLNFDTTYVKVTVNDNIFFDVTAENGITKIIYQLIPDVSENDAFLTSDVYTVSQKDLLIQFVPRGTSVQTLLANLVPSAGATIKLVDKLGHERMDGQFALDDKVIVTSPNGMYTTAYHISALSEEYFETKYLAYILSNMYEVNQETYLVSEVASGTSVADFFSAITSADGATAMLVDAEGVEKTTGNVSSSDMVKVTSMDGKITVTYSIGTLTSSGFTNSAQIGLYPNPTTGKINISGVLAGNKIQVYNSTGAMIRNISVQRNIETVSLDSEPAGMYMIVVSDSKNILGRFKAIKR
ncbi:MAG: T9SS type A sorting domain-containing protein [Draconibacterium sp.]